MDQGMEDKTLHLVTMNLIVKRIERELNQLKNLIKFQIHGLTESTATTNCDGHPDGNCDTSINDGLTGANSTNCNGNCDTFEIIDNDTYCPMDIIKIEHIDQTTQDYDCDYDTVNNYQEEFNDDQENCQNRTLNKDELELQLLPHGPGGLNFNFEDSSTREDQCQINPSFFSTNLGHNYDVQQVMVEKLQKILKKVEHEAKSQDSVDLKPDVENLETSFEVAGKNDKKLTKKLIVQMGTRCENNPTIMQSNRVIDRKGAKMSQSKLIVSSILPDKTVDISSKPKSSSKKVSKSHICSFCSKSFQSFYKLLCHKKVHTGERDFKCKICSKSFTLKGNLRRHNMVHTGLKPFSCSICSKAFLRNPDLKDHMRIHTGERPFSCPVCSKTFIRSSRLSRHMVIHTDERPYSCSICSKTFNRTTSLNHHMNTHTGVKPFSCSICYKNFSRSDHLKRHEKIHGQENSA